MTSDIDEVVESFTTLHYYNARCDDYVGSAGRLIIYKIGKNQGSFFLPQKWRDLFSFSRPLTRMLRLDKVNIINISESSIIILRQNIVYRFSFASKEYCEVLNLPTTRNILMGGACNSEDGLEIYFGDYGGSKTAKNIYQSKDDGYSWEVCHTYESAEVKQVLNISWDKYGSHYYVSTGDEMGQCKISVFDRDMKYIETIGDGSLIYRAISISFFENEVCWVTNDPYRGSKVYSLDRVTRSLVCKTSILGSVWYSQKLEDGRFLLSTCAENIDDANARVVRVYISDNYYKWTEFCAFNKDFYPKFLFRFGLVSFPRGNYGLADTFINAEAISSYDGSVLRLVEFESHV